MALSDVSLASVSSPAFLPLPACFLCGSGSRLGQPQQPKHRRPTVQCVTLASSSTRLIEGHTGIPFGYFKPILGYSHEIANRARQVVASPHTRYALMPEPGNPTGALAFTAYPFIHEGTGRTRHAVLMLGLTPRMSAQILGEAHLPDQEGQVEASDAWRRLRDGASWDGQRLIQRFGPDVFHI